MKIKRIPKGDKRIIFGWVIYDWANSVYQLTIASAIFPIYYNQVTKHNAAFMKFFTWLGALSCGMLFFFTGDNVEFGIIFFALGTLGYGGSLVFYNSFLPVIAEPKEQDRISARGYSLGYCRPGLPFLLSFSGGSASHRSPSCVSQNTHSLSGFTKSGSSPRGISNW